MQKYCKKVHPPTKKFLTCKLTHTLHQLLARIKYPALYRSYRKVQTISDFLVLVSRIVHVERLPEIRIQTVNAPL